MKKKNNSLKLFNKLAKRAYKVSKQRKLGWKWSDAQKFTSKNLFQKYKGLKNLSKLKVTEIDVQVIAVLDGTVQPLPQPTPVIPQKYCFNPFDVGSFMLETFEWFELDDKVSVLNDDLQVDLDLELYGTVFAKTGIVSKSSLPNLIEIREKMRKVITKSGFYIGFYIVLIEGREDDRNIACNYYVLITFEDSSELKILESKGLVKREYVSKEQMPTTELERIELFNKMKQEEKKILTKQKAKSFELPSKVETKSEPKEDKKSSEELKTIRWQEFNKAKESYRRDLDDGIITKEEYRDIILKLEKKLEKGGEI